MEHSIWVKVVRSMFVGSHAEMIINYLKLKGNAQAESNTLSKTQSFKTDMRAEDRKKNQTMAPRGRSRSKYLSKSSTSIINQTPRIGFHDLVDVILND